MKPDDLLPLPRNFTLTLAERVRAQEGVPAHLRRWGQIERLIEAALAELRALAGVDAATLRQKAASLPPVQRLIDRINDLVAKHNLYYPIEANLPIDPETGGSRDWKPLERVTVDWLLTRL